MDGEEFMFNAPQFIDLTAADYEDGNKTILESYFDIDHENGGHVLIIEDEDDVEETFFSPLKSTPSVSNAQHILEPNLRRSLSMGSILPRQSGKETLVHPEDDVDNLNAAINALEIVTNNRKSRGNEKNNNTKLFIKRKGTSLERPKQKNSSYRPSYLQSTDSSSNLRQEKYVSMAEAIINLQNKTPTRFRTKPKHIILKGTIPHSPELATKSRARPMSSLSIEEQEKKQAEEMKKFKIKSNPVNLRILQGPMKLVVPEKKPSTVIEPFNITEVHPKVILKSPKPDTHFHARPVPKSVLEPPKNIIKPNLFKVPPSPNSSKRFAPKISQLTKPINKHPQMQPFKPSRTHLEPFSFEDRDKHLVKKKEEFIKKVFEEEKKQREFHARPPPSYILKVHNGSAMSIKSDKSDEHVSNKLPQFKARPAKVLEKKPFIPIKLERPVVEVKNFTLNTNKRAKEREEFEKKQKEREATIEETKKQMEQEQLRIEEEMILKLRKESEHKAQPIRRFKSITPISPKPMTDPISPKFHLNSMNNKENIK